MRVLAPSHLRTWLYFTCALGLILAAPAAAQQTPAGSPKQDPASTAAKPTGYTIFLRGAPVGREEVTVQEDATGTTITVQGRLGAPINAITRRAELKYAPNGTPERFVLDGSINGNDVSVRTSFVNGTAQTEGNQGPTKISTSHAFSPQAIVLPNGVFSLYAALADRLSRNAGTVDVDATGLACKSVRHQLCAVAAEGIGLDDIGSSLDIVQVNVAHQFGAGDVQFIEATADENAFAIEHGAHGSINDEDPLFK